MVHDEYDSWRGKIARKVQAPIQEAQCMQRQQAVNAMFAQLGTTDPWMNQSMMGQTPYNPMAMAGMGYPNPVMANMWNRGGMGVGPVPAQFQRQQSSQGQRDLGGSGDSGGGAIEAFLNVTTAALNLASAEVGGGGGGDGGNGANGNGLGGAGSDWGVNYGPSGGGPGYNDGFGSGNGYGSGFNSGPGFGNGFGGPGYPVNGGFGNASGFY